MSATLITFWTSPIFFMSFNLKLITNFKRLVSLYQNGARFCAFDTETTGIDPRYCRIIELGAVIFTKDGISDTYSTLVNPEEPIPPQITELTGISDSMVCDAPSALKVIPEFKKFCQDTILVAHNAQFDLRFVNAESQRLELMELSNEAVDTLRLSRIMLPENTTWKQPELAKQFNIDTGHAHRAFDDAKVCSQLFSILVNMKIPPKTKRRRLAAIASKQKNLETSFLASQALSN